MKRFIMILMLVLPLAACRKEPDMGKTDGGYMVYTAYDTSADFSSFNTFVVADSMLVMDSGRYSYVRETDSRTVRTILDEYRAQMTALGYQEVDSRADADLGLQVSYIEDTQHFVDFVPSDPYWWWGYPGYWSPSWWGGYYGSWAPYSYPVSYSYTTHSFLTEMVDLTPLTGDPETDKDIRLEIVWNSYLDGSLVSSQGMVPVLREAIIQSFAQSLSNE